MRGESQVFMLEPALLALL